MLAYPEINPVAFHIGSWPVYWYGLMYLIGFTGAWLALSHRLKTAAYRDSFTTEQLSDIFFYAALGIIIGGRLGYMIFYATSDLINDPLLLFQPWKGGMSFHGGFIGTIVALWIYARHINKSLIDITDFIAPAVPIGLAAGRIGNFINGELFGRITDVPWAMVFPTGGPLPRHPSQLYEFFLEGVLLFTILWLFSKKQRPRWAVSAMFLTWYGLFRFFVEFFRLPDSQRGYLAFGWLTEGQLLSLPMVIIGLAFLISAYRRNK